MRRLLLSSALVTLILPLVAEARIISYAPLTDRQAVPAVQKRTNRHYALIENNFSTRVGTVSQLVVYDSRGQQEPRVVFPKDASPAVIQAAAVWEGTDDVPFILISTNARLNGDNSEKLMRFLLSTNGGSDWKVAGIQPGFFVAGALSRGDTGGPLARGHSSIRPGTREVPFVIAITNSNYYYPGPVGIAPPQSQSPVEIHAIRNDGSARRLMWVTNSGPQILLGSNREGTKFLVAGSPLLPESLLPNAVRALDLNGVAEEIVALPNGNPGLTGWITPEGSVYLESSGFNGPRAIVLYRNGVRTELLSTATDSTTSTLFAVPTFDFSGAWIVTRGISQPTILYRHQGGGALVEQWRDAEGPEVEAVHSAESGQRLLIQVHRARVQTDQRLFLDPALAIWEIGSPAPGFYDELYLNEGTLKGFVHLDVDRTAAGETFVFDSAMTSGGGIVVPISPAPPGGGGGDVIQEWGVVRASLRQRLMIPSISQLAGAYGSHWKTDITLRNPSDKTVNVELKFVPSSGLQGDRTTSLQLAPRELRLIRNAVEMFNLSLSPLPYQAAGPLFITPEIGYAVMATSRTYNESSTGTFGMGIQAVDLSTAASSRFSFTFAGALQGSDFRTNILVTDVSGRGSRVALRTSGRSGFSGRDDLNIEAPGLSQVQLNGLATSINFPGEETGALLFSPLSGEAIGSAIAIDNRTNDPSYFSPDLPTSVVRTIPAIVHLDGANGSQFRSDLFLFNPSDQIQSINLALKRWDVNENESMVAVTLQPREARTISGALKTLYGRTGVGRLRYMSSGPENSSIRVTSRLYTIRPDGGTYGLVLPPLNAFQSGGEGDTLEILGAVHDGRFRTNLSLVELSATAVGGASPKVHVEIIDASGRIIKTQDVTVPRAGGIQLLDVLDSSQLALTTGGPVMIRVSPSGDGLVGAFATMIDNGTNDPLYLAASLSSK